MWPFKNKEEVPQEEVEKEQQQQRANFIVTYTDNVTETVEGTGYNWSSRFLNINDDEIGYHVLSVQSGMVKSVKTVLIDKEKTVS